MSASDKSKTEQPIAASLAHELLAPLQALLSHADMLEATDLTAEQRGLLEMIRRSGQSLQALITDVVDVTRLQTGQIAVAQREFDVQETLEDAIAGLIPEAYGKGLELVLLVYRDVPARLYGDPLRLQQILAQLAGAGLERSTQGSVAVRVMLESETAQGVVLRFNISDTGVGITTGDDAGLGPGSISAAVALGRQLVQLLGGQLEPPPGGSPGFSFVLPFERSNAAALQPWLGLQGRQIRIIDSNLLFRTALAHHLELWGVEIVQQGSLANLALSSTQVNCDVAVLGLHPQEIQQAEIVSFIGQCRARGIPVLSLIASMDEEVHRRVRALGAVASLPKSVNRLTLYRVLNRLVGMAPRSEERRLDLHELPVLVADDVLANRRLLKVLLEQLGAAPDVVEGGEQAVAAWRRKRHRLVLTDVRMPDLDGAEVARRIRAEEGAQARCVVIGITAALDAPLRRQLLDAGMNDCILKPADRQALLRDLKPWVIEPPELPSLNLSPVPAASASPQLAQSQAVLQQNPELLTLLAEALPLQVNGLAEAISRNNTDTIRDELHQLHGTAAFYRLNLVRDCVAQLEQSLRRDGLLVVDSLLPLRRAVEALLGEIQTARNSAPPGKPRGKP